MAERNWCCQCTLQGSFRSTGDVRGQQSVLSTLFPKIRIQMNVLCPVSSQSDGSFLRRAQTLVKTVGNFLMNDLSDFYSPPFNFFTCFFFQIFQLRVLLTVFALCFWWARWEHGNPIFHVPQLHSQCIMVPPVLAGISCFRRLIRVE